MATSVTFNNTVYSIPANREARGWGTSLSLFLVDVANSSLSKAGGSFTLTADANFGSNYGLVVKYIKSVSSNIAASGVVRFANNEGIGWRNAANGADKVLKLDAGDRLEIDGVDIVTVSSTDTLTNKTLTSPAITTPTGIVKGDVGLGNVDNTSDANKPVSTAQQTALDLKANLASPTLVTPTIDDYLILNEESSPGTAGAGTVRIYAKTDKKIYKKDSNGTESELGAGGTSAVNYISNYDFETGATTGWATYDDGASATPVDGTGGAPSTLTLSANSSSPMRGSYDFKVAKSAANSQGEGFSYDFTIKTPDKSKKLSISFDLTSNDSNYTAGDVVVYVYDVTNSTLITPSTTSLPKVGASTYNITFDSTTSTSYRLIFHWAVTTATAVNLYFDNIVVGPGTVVQGAAVGEWQNVATPLYVSGPTTSTSTQKWRRVGSTMEVEGFLISTGAGAGSTFAALLPSGYTIDTTAMAGTSAAGVNTRGTAQLYDGTNFTAYNTYCYVSGSTQGIRFLANGTATDLAGTGLGTGRQFGYKIAVPISEWAGNGTVNLGAGAQVEYAYNTSSATTGNDTTSFGYGPAGAQIVNITAAGSRRVRFQYPIQDGDILEVQVKKSASAPWVVLDHWDPNTGLQPYQVQSGGAAYGMGIDYTAVNSTDVDVLFGTYCYASGATLGAAGGAWSTANAFKWRVRKVSASSPVGFGLAGTDGSSGLVAPYSTSGIIASSTYTPTVTGVTNIDSASNATGTYMRVGKTVTVSVVFDCDATTAANTASEVGISLPIASDFTNGNQCSGGGTVDAASGTANAPAQILSDATNNRARFLFNATSTSSRTATAHFTYTIL